MTLGTQSRFGGVVLVVAGAAFVALATTAMLTSHDALAGTFGVLALLAFTLAALSPRMKGEVRAGLNGFRFELVREVVEAGERTGSPNDVILEAVRQALREQGHGQHPKEDEKEEWDDTFRDPAVKQPITLGSAYDLLAEARQAVAARHRN